MTSPSHDKGKNEMPTEMTTSFFNPFYILKQNVRQGEDVNEVTAPT